MKYIIYCDESEQKGEVYSNFYGGALVKSTDVEMIEKALAKKKNELNFGGEVKWIKISENYAGKYIELMDLFFDLIEQDKLKIRIMFSKNSEVDTRDLSQRQREKRYFLLYYQFLKYAFGLKYCNPKKEDIKITLLFDKLPDNKEKTLEFKSYISMLHNTSDLKKANIDFAVDRIHEIDSHKHNILQCLDVILGGVNFHLNEKYLGTGKRTKAKELIFKHILKRIQKIHTNFNIGITTESDEKNLNVWKHKYRHWKIIPKK